jgi:hypothetical protein
MWGMSYLPPKGVKMAEFDKYILHHANWEWTFAWLPHKCQLTDKRIWLKYAYRGIARVGDYMDPVFIIWRTTDAHIAELLTR